MAQAESGRVVEVVPYDDSWNAKYADEEARLRRVLGREVVAIHHIGSTAIPGMSAKPTIDILVVVRDIDIVDRYNQAMETLGYVAKGEYGIKGRRFFTKGINNRTHHVHIFQKGSHDIDRHLMFRDFLISRHSEAARYAELKKELAARFRTDAESYCQGKVAFIGQIDAKAAAWAKSKGRQQT